MCVCVCVRVCVCVWPLQMCEIALTRIERIKQYTHKY